LYWRDALLEIHDDLNMPAFPLKGNISPKSKEPPGSPHHHSLEVLEASASDCELCDLIYSSVSSFVTSYREAEKDPVFMYYQGKILGLPSDFQLWLTKRLNSRDGFLVFVRARSER
jgi:hypothetical protein